MSYRYFLCGMASVLIFLIFSGEHGLAESANAQAATVLSNALFAVEKGDYEVALRSLTDARSGLQSDAPPFLRYAILNNLGACHAALDHPASAYRAYREALLVIRETDNVDQLLALAVNLGALCIRMGKPEEALQYSKLVSAICVRLARPDPVESIGNRGTAEFMLGRYVEAESTHREALKMLGVPRGRQKSLLFANLAADLAAQKKYSEALELLEQNQVDVNGAASPDETSLLTARIAYIQALAGNIARAESELSRLGDDFDGGEHRLAARIMALATRAELTRRAKDYAKEARLRERIISLLEDAWDGGEGKDPLLKQANAWRYLDLADAWLRAGDPSAAMRWLEIGRRAEERRLASSSVTLLEDPVLLAIIEDCLALSHEPPKHGDEGVARATIEREKRFEEAKAELRKKSPDYWQALFADRLNVHPDEMNQLSGVLALGITFVEPVIFRDKVAIFVCSAGKPPECRTVPFTGEDGHTDSESVRKLVTRMRILLSRPSPPTQVRDVCGRLYDLILKPIEGVLAERKTKIILVSPVGFLRYVPFAALHDGDRYLVERYPVATITGLDLIRLAGADGHKEGFASLVAFADPNGSLPGAREECRVLAGLFPGAEVLEGDGATMERFLTLSGRTTFVHLATHGVLDPTDPTSSHLVFSRGGKLTYADMMGIPFLKDLRLLTMSACNTASTTLGDGAEMSGMAYQFIRKTKAGAVVASQWKVDDAATGVLMQAFYRQMRDRMKNEKRLGRAESLAAAQRVLLAETKTAHPFYWAGFVLIGDYR